MLVLAINILIMAWASQEFIMEQSKPALQDDSPQFAVICNEPGNDWISLRQGIDRAAEEYGVAVEYIVSAFSGSEADADSIYMAVESRVAGIAIFQTFGHTGQAIAYAKEKGIPVVTMVNDETDSEYDIFVGINDDLFGQYLLEAVQGVGKRIRNVGLIYNKEINPERSEAVEAVLRQEYDLQVVSRTSSYIFDTSETMKELTMNSKDLEVICCVDDNTTQGVAQTVVDWNMVNKLHIVGTGDSENVLSMVEKGIISATIVTDYERIGSKAIETLYDAYRDESGIYEPVDKCLYVVTQETLDTYVKEREHEA